MKNKPDGTDKINKVYLSIVDSGTYRISGTFELYNIFDFSEKGAGSKEHLRTAVYLKPECVDCWLTLFDLEYKR